jgi:predicted metalloprotease with PDZ domain
MKGMTQYWGNVLAARSAFWTPEIYREALAWSAARLDQTRAHLAQPGRHRHLLPDSP